MIKYICEIPALPPSVNSIYKRNKYGGVHKAETVLAFEKEAMLIIKRPTKPLSGFLVVDIKYTFGQSGKFQRSDIDNLLKVTLDMLTHFGIIDDDRHIMELHASKYSGPKDQTKITIIVA